MAAQAMSPQQISEEVEAVEEEILEEEAVELEEAPRTPLTAQQRANKEKPSNVLTDIFTGDSPQRRALRRARVAGDKEGIAKGNQAERERVARINKEKEKASFAAKNAGNPYPVRPGAVEDKAKKDADRKAAAASKAEKNSKYYSQFAATKDSKNTKSRAANLPSDLKSTEAAATQKANEFRKNQEKNKGTQSTQSTQSTSQSSSQRSTSQPAASTQRPSTPAAKPTPAAPARDRMANASKADRMAAWAKANPTLAKKNPPKPAKPNALQSGGAAARSAAGAGKVMNSAPKPAPKPQIKSDRLRTALSNVKPVKPSAGAQAALKASGAVPGSTKLNLKNSVEMSEFDVILEHLIEQGFPQEEALKLMVNMSEEKREQILEMKHRDAKTGEVVDKPEIGKIYYPHGERKKSSVALRKEKEAAEKKTQKEEVVSEEDSDRLKDRHLERGGHAARSDYSKPPANNTSGKKKSDPDAMRRALEAVKSNIRAKYGENALIDTDKKKKKD